MPIPPLEKLNAARFDTPLILKTLARASRQLAELKGLAASMPDQGMLINTLGLQEAKDSSAIENIVTTHDELFRDQGASDSETTPAAKEVQRYRQALRVGFNLVQQHGLLTVRHMEEIQAQLEHNNAGLRKVPGTVLRDAQGRVVYTPPQSAHDVARLMFELQNFINDDRLMDVDPLIKMALIHHQFESIHPFYDGNGRTGRIVNVLYLVQQGLLNSPILYLSRAILQTKAEYYRLLQAVHEHDQWEQWVVYLLLAIEQSAAEGITTVRDIKQLLLQTKHQIRNTHKFYSQDLINNLFSHPYTKIEFLMRDLRVSRLTATKYLEALVQSGVLTKQKHGRSNYYIHGALVTILTRELPRR